MRVYLSNIKRDAYPSNINTDWDVASNVDKLTMKMDIEIL